ncbi:hypothetical protein [Actinoplanes sp. G11-F43]|uniref:hypothetical protein n=1 Tax=Actinoplanes sp. G11-F43 TaxID=3424130 RepID=UPI003D340183
MMLAVSMAGNVVLAGRLVTRRLRAARPAAPENQDAELMAAIIDAMAEGVAGCPEVGPGSRSRCPGARRRIPFRYAGKPR